MKNLRGKALYSWVPVFLYCVFIYLLSSMREPVKLPELPYIDKVIHVGLYAVLGLLYTRAHINQWGRESLLGTIAFTLFYGVTDEIHQSFVPGRQSSLWDIVADTAGGIAGFFAYFLLRGIFFPGRRYER